MLYSEMKTNLNYLPYAKAIVCYNLRIEKDAKLEV